MADEDTTPPRDANDPAAASTTTSDAAWTGTHGPSSASAGDGRIWVPPGGTLPGGWYESPRKPGWRRRARSLVTRRVPVLAAALALLVGLGVGGGAAFAVADGHGGHAVVDGRGGRGTGGDQHGSGR